MMDVVLNYDSYDNEFVLFDNSTEKWDRSLLSLPSPHIILRVFSDIPVMAPKEHRSHDVTEYGRYISFSGRSRDSVTD
jgi:hypothetical protein